LLDRQVRKKGPLRPLPPLAPATGTHHGACTGRVCKQRYSLLSVAK
jgi:hypothetical protein